MTAFNSRQPLLVRVGGDRFFKTDWGIVEKDTAATFAKHHGFAVAEILKELRAQQNLAGGATSFQSLGDG